MHARADATQPISSGFAPLSFAAISLYASSQLCLDKLPVLPDEGGRKPCRAVYEFVGLVSANADLALVHRVTVPWLDASNLAVLDGKIDSAPGSAIGAGAWDILEIHSQTSFPEQFRLWWLYKPEGFYRRYDEYRWVKSPDLIYQETIIKYRAGTRLPAARKPAAGNASNSMNPILIPPMACDLIQDALCSLDGVEFTDGRRCPVCGGAVQGHDVKTKKFATVRDHGVDRDIHVKVKRFTCRICGSLCYAEEPFYPGTRIGSPVIDFCTTISRAVPFNRTAKVLEAIGIIVDRGSIRNFSLRSFPEVTTVDVFGMRIPFSVLSLSSISARIRQGTRVPGAEVLAACGFPSAYRAAPYHRLLPEERNEREK